MTRKRTTAPEPPASDAVERLIEAAQKLACEMGCLRSAVEKLQDDFAWALNNDVFRRVDRGTESVPPFPVTSMPLDPLALDWARRLNRLGPEDVPHEVHLRGQNKSSIQKNLFESEEPSDGQNT
jgi:hypothetical protein